MNGVTPRPVMSAPLASPQRPPTATPQPRAAGIGRPASLMSVARTTVTSATAEPTDRSIPPAIITAVIPSAAIPTMTACTAIIRQVNAWRNIPVCRER